MFVNVLLQSLLLIVFGQLVLQVNYFAQPVGIQPVRYTIKGIREHGTFSINIPSVKTAKMVDYCGLYSGKKKDKSHIFRTFYGTLETAPLIDECPVNLECAVKHSLDLGSHILFVGEIVET
ncbi:MAG: flavin reductase family protein, partial [Anaerolineales bacterium]|nr:flavin reductase family protein [Anaerolineales bacterium]